MPKTAIHKHSHTFCAKDKIGFTCKFYTSSPTNYVKFTQKRGKALFRGFVPLSANPRHAFASLSSS